MAYNLSQVNAGLEKTTLRQLLAQSELINQRKSKHSVYERVHGKQKGPLF